MTEAEAAFQESEIGFISARQALVNLGLEMAEHFDGRDATKLAEEIRFLGIPPAILATLPAETKTANLLPLRTPYAGVVVASDVVSGEVVDATKLLFTVADPRSLWLLLSVRQEDARYVVPGLPVEFQTDNGSQRRPRDRRLAQPDRRRTVAVAPRVRRPGQFGHALARQVVRHRADPAAE